MEKFPNQESERKINFLDKKFKFSLSIDKEASEFLPEITQEDMQTKKEKFRFLLGNFNTLSQEEIKISIKGVFEDDEEIFYKEGKEEIHNLHVLSAVNFVEELQKNPEFKDWKLIGDIHTHPCKPSEFEQDFVPWMPSEGDIDSLIKNYEKNVLKEDEPYIFGIAAPNEDGKTLYAYYRIIKDVNGYSYQKI